jgi:iron complex outermembrane recepter protein
MNRNLSLRSASICALVVALAAASPLHAQQALPDIDIGAAAPRPVQRTAATPVPGPAPAAAPGFSEEKKKLPVYREPTGQTFTSIDTKFFKDTPLFSVRDILQYSPGLSFKQGNGPRDVVVSIRGSSARNGFGVRNIVLLEDGFPVTQPDGLSRTDLTDPHAYAGVDVYRGPSSALFGNFANGGAINFRTRTGAEIDGFETGHEFGSFGLINNYTAIGKKIGDFDIAVFASDVRSDGFTQHSASDTQTINMTASWQVTPSDKLVFKGIHNELYGDLSSRLSLNQYYFNPYQRHCGAVPTPVNPFSIALCGQSNTPINGISGGRAQISADMAGFHRNDRRDVFGLRWEHDFDKDTKWRTQVLYDDKNIIQPTSGNSSLQDEPAVNASTDITRHDSWDGHDITHYAGVFFSRTRYVSYTGNVLPIGNGAYGATTARSNALMQNLGVRFREELALSDSVTGVLGLAAEQTRISAWNEAFGYAANGQINSYIPVTTNHVYLNLAPEASITWRINPEWTTHFRASSGYGTPNPGQLFVTQQGVNGDNSDLKTQRNTGLDIGADWTPNDRFRASLTLFHEWYQNEQLSQTPGAGQLGYTFNAPGSVHRGVEALADWRPIDGARLVVNYSYNNQIFTNYTELLGTANPGGLTGYFNRAGYKIPNVAAHELTARAGYDVPTGDFKGLGGFVEYNYKSSYYVDNGNLLTIPSYGLVNVNAHYDHELQNSFLKSVSLYVQLNNVFDRTWVASANNVTNSVVKTNGVVVQNGYSVLAGGATGSIYAGAPRAIVGGVKFKF